MEIPILLSFQREYTEWENSKYNKHSFDLSLIYLDFLCELGVCKYLNMLKRVWPNRLHEYISQSVSNPSWDTLHLYFFFLPNHIHILIVHTYLSDHTSRLQTTYIRIEKWKRGMCYSNYCVQQPTPLLCEVVFTYLLTYILLQVATCKQ